MYVASYRNTVAGAKRIVPDREIDIAPKKRRENVIELSRRYMALTIAQQEATEAARAAAKQRQEERQALSARMRQRADEDAVKRLPERPARIIQDVAKRHGVPASAILSIKRDHRTVAARDEAVVAVYEKCRINGRQYTPTELGRVFNRDRTTMLYSLQKAGVRKRSEAA